MNIYISGFDMNGFKYILIVMGAAFISLLLVIFLITNFFIKNFDKISFYEYDILLKEKINLKNQGNDLVIIGDSSALNGIIPNQIIKTTKLKTYNLALYAHNGIESYKLLLKEYLKKNAPPKLVILYFSAQSPNNWDKTTYEKSILIFKYSDFKNKISYILKNPSSIIIITNRAIRATLRYKLFGSKKQKKFSKNLLIKLKDNKGFIESTANMSHNKCKFKYSNFKNESLIKNVKSFKSNFPRNIFFFIPSF